MRALVTGASAGLGVAFAEQLAARGIDLVLVARRADRLEQVAERLRAQHRVQVETVAADLSRPDGVEAIPTDSVDWLVNNAGSAMRDLLSPDTAWEEHLAAYTLMMTSVAHLCARYLPLMRARGFGRVINVASFAGRVILPYDVNYGSAKAYVVALSEELWLANRGTNVHVTALCPGFVHTEFHTSHHLAQMKESTPKWLWYDAATVAREGLWAVERNRPMWISGRLYRWLEPLGRFDLTRRWVQQVVGRR